MGNTVQFQGDDRSHKFTDRRRLGRPQGSASTGTTPASLRCVFGAALLLFFTGCSGSQSALDPAGRAAEQLADLFWWMAIGAVIVWLIVVALALYTIYFRPEKHKARQVRMLIIGGGVTFPTIVLTGLLIYGLRLLPDLNAPAPEGSLKITVSGEQWWWRIRYELPGREPVISANEIHLPVGEPVQFILESPDVIHAFWIPSLGGKIDMIPGRTTTLRLEPTRTGTFRGACAEYCGASHALMMFFVVVHEKEEFERWLDREATPAPTPAEPLARRGAELFRLHGCAACHTVRGTDATGTVGPDLTHVGSRLSLGAGVLPNDPADFEHWLAHTDAVKPEVRMPHFNMLPPDDLRALAAYLDGLQ